MIYAKDKDGKLRSFTTDCDKMDLQDVSSHGNVQNLKFIAQKEAGLVLEGAVLKVIGGGKE